MTMKNIKLVLTTAIFATLFGCVNNDNYADPDLSGECGDLTATKTVQNIATLATGSVISYNSTVAPGVSADDIIEAYVTSSDEGGNFYKSISMVSLDGTKGFSVPVDDYNLYTKFEPGRKVYIKMKDRYFYNNPFVYYRLKCYINVFEIYITSYLLAYHFFRIVFQFSEQLIKLYVPYFYNYT